MKVRFVLLVALAVVILFSFAATVAAYEKITSFRSDIAISKDGAMYVTETIRVISEGVDIKHGIFRDFPTRYKDNDGNNYIVDFKVESVLRDGVARAVSYNSCGQRSADLHRR